MADAPVITDPSTESEPDAQPADDKPLGESGEKALQAWKERAKKAEADAKRAAELEARLAEIEAASMSEHEKAINAARKEAAESARSEVLDHVQTKLFAAEVRAAAHKLSDPDLIADPEVAVRLLGFDSIPVTDGGDIDAEAISAAVDRFIEAKPHLSASATQRPASIDQGARTNTAATKTLNEQIQEAETAGDWKRAGELKLHKLAAIPRP